MKADLTFEQGQLAGLMSEISERCYCAGWMKNLEYVLWNSLLEGERTYGHDTITEQDIKALKDFSGRANCWILFDDYTEEKAIDIRTWQQKFQYETQRRPDILVA